MQDLKLGCLYPSPFDRRDLSITGIMNVKQLYIPDTSDAEKTLNGGKEFPGRMLGNDLYSDCLAAAIANISLVLEYIEQGHLINISDSNVISWYLTLTGGLDIGLYVPDTMKIWRNDGWYVDGGRVGAAKKQGCWRRIKPKPQPAPESKQHIDIYAFAQIKNITEIAAAVNYLGGAIIAVKLTQRDIDLFNAGEEWSLKNSPGTDYKGGHGMYVPTYYKDESIEARTWAKRHLIKQDWLRTRMYDARAVVDNRDKFLANSPVNIDKLNGYLKQIEDMGGN